jgi:hypothetical protein
VLGTAICRLLLIAVLKENLFAAVSGRSDPLKGSHKNFP